MAYKYCIMYYDALEPAIITQYSTMSRAGLTGVYEGIRQCHALA